MIRKLLALTLLLGALTGCSGKLECTEGVCIVVPEQTKAPQVESTGLIPPPIIAPSPNRKKAGRPTKTPHVLRSGKTVSFLMRYTSARSPLFITHHVEGRKGRSVAVRNYLELAYRSEPYYLVFPGNVASMEVRPETERVPVGLSCWIEVNGKVAAKSEAVDGACWVKLAIP